MSHTEKITSCFILLLIINNTTFAQDLKRIQTFYDPYKHLQIKEDYTVLNTPPYQMHGLYRLWDQEKALVQEINYSNGKKQGISKTYYNYLVDHGGTKIGKVWQVIPYVNDVLDGNSIEYDYLKGGAQIKVKEFVCQKGNVIKQMEYHSNGVLASSIVLNGSCFTYYKDSKLASKYSNKDGKMNGQYISYYPSGKLEMKAKYLNDTEVDTTTIYYEDGKLALFRYRNPLTQIIEHFKEKYPNGKLKRERKMIGDNLFSVVEYDSIGGYIYAKYNEMINFKESDLPYIKTGNFQSFHENGKPKYTTGHKEGYSNGICQLQDDKGNILLKGQLNDGYKIGEWKVYYDEDWEMAEDMEYAKFYRIINYTDKGEISGLVNDFYISGNKQFEGKLKSIDPDVLNGEAKFYYDNGKLQTEALVYNGQDTSYIRHYNEREVLVEDIAYKLVTNDFNRDQLLRCVKNYRDDGTHKESGCYVKSILRNSILWKKDGAWEYFDPKGTKIKSEKFSGGDLITSE